MQKELNAIEQFRTFSKKAQTRCGVPFKCLVFQVNQRGEPSSVKGEIYVKGENGDDIPIEMIWSMDGQAMLIGNGYDLVTEVPFE